MAQAILTSIRKWNVAALWDLLKAGPRVTRIYWRVKMPRATVSKLTERRSLTTLPAADATDTTPASEEGWIELRRMSYGEKMAKDSEAMKMKFATEAIGNVDAEIAMVSEAANILEIQKCVMDHNLEDEHGNKLNFQNVDHIRQLDPRVGQEITTLIGEMNDFEKQSKESPGVDAKGK